MGVRMGGRQVSHLERQSLTLIIIPGGDLRPLAVLPFVPTQPLPPNAAAVGDAGNVFFFLYFFVRSDQE